MHVSSALTVDHESAKPAQGIGPAPWEPRRGLAVHDATTETSSGIGLDLILDGLERAGDSP